MTHYSVLLYIDPGTGAMLFTALIGIITTASFALRKLGIKLKFLLSGGKTDTKKDNAKLPIVIFSDHKRYWNVFKPICDEFEKREHECYYYTASSDDPALDEVYKHVKCEFIGEGNKAFARLNMMNAHICLSTTPGLDVYQWKRSKDTDYYVHIPHSVGTLTMYRMFGLDFYDAVLLNGEFQKRTLRKIEELRHLKPKELQVVGCTYFDSMNKRLESVNKSEDANGSLIKVLLAPSWGKNGILSKYGRDFLKALEDTGFDITVRPHPQSQVSEKDMLDKLEQEFPETERWHWNYDNDNFDVLRNSDIMVSDFSGVIYDYAFVFDGALIYTDIDYDKSAYDACWIDEPIWAAEVLPKIGRKLGKNDVENIKSVIEDTVNSREFSEGRREMKETVWMYQNEAAVRTVDYLINKLEGTVIEGE